MSKTKTDIRLSQFLYDRITETTSKLGITKNAFHVAAASLFLVVLHPIIGKKTKEDVNNVVDKFNKLIDWYRNSL